MKKWNILNNHKFSVSNFKSDKLINILLINREIDDEKNKEDFLNPQLKNVTIKSCGISKIELSKTIKRIEHAIKNKEKIIIYGDYDVDGITGTAILWETIHSYYKNVMPYIPHRANEGYGLSVQGINSIKNASLIITVDNGIVANEAVDYAKKKGIDVIITDHHLPSDDLPNAYSIVHTTQLCGAGVAYLLSQELKKQKSKKLDLIDDNHLELAALGTIADLVPLVGANRILVKNGLIKLSQTKRKGLLFLFKKSGIDNKSLTPYDVGFIIAPRLNAAGRIESAIDSLRLLCTKNPTRASFLAEYLETINRQRQEILKQSSMHAIDQIKKQKAEIKKLLIISSKTYQQGIIGLMAGKLVEEFYRPSIVLSIDQIHTKASARSISGFNMVEFLRSHSEFFVNIGGHPMAAGFTVETKKLSKLQEVLEKSALTAIADETLKRSLKIDCELPFTCINTSLFSDLQILAPFGMGNPEPTFASSGVKVKNFRLLGKNQSHLKLELEYQNNEPETIEAIGFGFGKFAQQISPNDQIDIAYTIDQNTWNGNTKLQLKLKDLKLHEQN